VSLRDEPDERFMRSGPDKRFSIKNCYYALNFGSVSCVVNQEIWNSLALKKCKFFAWVALKKCNFFAWVALHNRLNTKERLTRRGVVNEASCPFGCHTNEGLAQMLFNCPHTIFLWRKFSVQNLQDFISLQDSISNTRLVQPAQ
jgi:hypothetical protein